MVLLDGNIRMGRALNPAGFDTSTVDKAHEMLDFFGISKALIRRELQEGWSAIEGNEAVVKFCGGFERKKGSDRLIPVWNLLSHHTGEFPKPENLTDAMTTSGVSALAVLKDIQFPLEETIFSGETLEVMEKEKIPLLYSIEQESELIKVGKILSSFPQLTLIICINKPAWGIDRYSWPLFEKFPRFRICLSGYHISGSVQETVKRFTAEKFVFGSGYPFLNPGGAVEFLKRLDIDDSDKEKIASGNMNVLLDWGRKK